MQGEQHKYGTYPSEICLSFNLEHIIFEKVPLPTPGLPIREKSIIR